MACCPLKVNLSFGGTCRLSLQGRRIGKSLSFTWGARGSAVGWGSMLQAGRSRDRVPMRWISSRIMALVSTQPLEKWVPGIFLEVKGGRRVRLTSLPPSVSRMPRRNVGAWTSHNPMGLHGLLQGALPYSTYPTTDYRTTTFSKVSQLQS
jgi:hypothetical protein